MEWCGWQKKQKQVRQVNSMSSRRTVHNLPLWNCVVITRIEFNTLLNCLKYTYITPLDFVLFELSSNSTHIILADC